MPQDVAPAAPVLPLSDPQARLMDAWLAGRNERTTAAYRRDLADFAIFVGCHSSELAARHLLSLSHGDANGAALAYRAALIGAGLQPATVNRRLAALRSLVRLGNMLGLIGWRLDVESVKAASYRDTRGPGRSGFRALLELAAQPGGARAARDVAIVRLLHDVALRRGEVVSLDLEHCDRRRGTVAVLGKGRTQRELITLPAATSKALEAWIALRGDAPGPLFHRLDAAGTGGKEGRGRLTGAAVYDLVRSLGAAAGIRARPHGLRHSAITEALDRSNGNVRAVQRFSRHRDIRVLTIYDDSRQDLAGEMARLVAED